MFEQLMERLSLSYDTSVCDEAGYIAKGNVIVTLYEEDNILNVVAEGILEDGSYLELDNRTYKTSNGALKYITKILN